MKRSVKIFFLGIVLSVTLYHFSSFTDNRGINSTENSSFSIILAWDPSEGPDLVGYKVYWGHRSRNYIYSQDVGNSTSTVIAGLQKFTHYYFAVISYNQSGYGSSFSNEVALYDDSPATIEQPLWETYK